MLLRPATESDQHTIRVLVREGGINPMDLDWRHFVVAENEAGEAVAIGQIKTHRDGSPELASIAVRKDQRGQGLARAVIEHLLTLHSGDLYLTCRSNFGPMYEKFGFREIHEEKMPKYFRRLKKVAGVFEMLAGQGEYMMVMKRGSGW